MMIQLHDALNPELVVYVDPKSITAIYPVQGTTIVVTYGHQLGVSESVEEVYRKREQQ
jgi:uncharacterized protein YlzI (FlbEa/FlbD family)